MQEIVFASSNKGKCQEVSKILEGKFLLTLQGEHNVPDIEETGLTFVENSILKARNAAKLTNLPAIADDSGLVVKALNGAPGLYSARYSGKGTNAKSNIELLLKNMTGISERSAHFYCAMVYLKAFDDPAPIIIIKSWQGSILEQPSCKMGFGYDPIFWVPTHNCSAAELDADVKNTISHRGQALQELANRLLSLS